MPAVDFLAKIVEQKRDGKPRPRYRLETENAPPAGENPGQASGGHDDHEDRPRPCPASRRQDKRKALPFACSTTPGWLWAGPWAVRSDRMEAARLEGGEVAAASAAILRDANGLPGDPRNRLVLRDGPRKSSTPRSTCTCCPRPAVGVRDLVGSTRDCGPCWRGWSCGRWSARAGRWLQGWPDRSARDAPDSLGSGQGFHPAERKG